jgi:hypothetical protein
MHIFPENRHRPASTTTAGAVLRARLRTAALRAVALALLAFPSLGWACACGCGIYEVGTSSMLPTGSGIMTYVDYDYQDQDHNWSGSSEAPNADNPDKDIRTSWETFGYQDMFNRSWGIRLEIPYEERHFVTVSNAPGGPLTDLNFSGFGDIRIEGVYTGFSPDLSSGLTFGLKLPTGSFTRNNAYGDIDRDSEIGSGSTDLLLGAYRRFNLGADYGWSGFTQALLDVPVLTQVRYRPGTEFDVAVGAYYNGWRIGRILVSPVGQLKVSVRGSDTGANATFPVASGFERLLVSPGIEFDLHPVKVYADIELPLYEHFTGNQVAAPLLFRLNVAYMF